MTVIDLPRPCLVVLIGAAGSGKSTFAARRFATDEILSSDAYRAAIAGDEADQRATRAAFAALHRDLGRRLQDRRTTVVDATNVEAHARRALLTRAAAAEVPSVAIVLAPPADLVHARNRGRSARVVAPSVVDRHLARLATTLSPPDRLHQEGFSEVVVLRTPEAIDGLAIRLRPAPRRPSG